METPAQSRSPIADLTYRNYDGPLVAPITRWWPIAKMSIRLSFKKKWYWILGIMGAYYYLIIMVILYFVTANSNGVNSLTGKDQLQVMLGNSQWHDQFLYGFSLAQLILMIIAMVIGSTAVSSDTFANALLIYLSRPLTKLDYLIGKWLGIFIPIAGICLVPMLVFYLYGGMGYAKYGFYSQDHLMLPKIILISMVTGAVHASLCVGISSLFKQPRFASGTYAIFYFLTLFFTEMVSGLYISDPSNRSEILRNLFYSSVDGVQIGMAKLILGSNGGRPFFEGSFNNTTTVPSPDAWFVLLLFFGMCAAGIYIAWMRIKPVEVVGS